MPLLDIRSRVIQRIRHFFHTRDYLEVDTPVRSPAIIPEAHIDPVTSGDHFLMASPELYMKRLLGRGYNRLFQICKCFRNDENGRFHLPEMTLLEWYGAGDTYLDLMAQCQALIRHVAAGFGDDTCLTYQGGTIDLSHPFERLTVARAFENHAPTSCHKALSDGTFDDIMAFDIEPHLGRVRPVFLMNYPADLASLAALEPRDPQVAQRCECYIAGVELANGFTELTCADTQRRRFMQANRNRGQMGKPALPLPDKFLEELSVVPPCAGMALGVDRLVMLFADAADIRQVVAFSPDMY